MLAFEQPLPRRPEGFFDRTPLAALAGLGVAWGLATAALPADWARVAGLAGAHGALLGTAVAWTAPRARSAPWAPLEAALLLALAATAARLLPWGSMAYAVVPAWLLWRRPARPAGPAWTPALAAAAGALFGLLLGAHLLVNASLTLGYRVRVGGWDELVGWWAYDLGANVLAAEAFFRGALFARAWRRWSFTTAAAISTGASLTRYLVDPLLPRAPEIAAGAAFYLVLLGAGGCWLLRRTGRLAAPLAAGACFFGAYRLLVR